MQLTLLGTGTPNSDPKRRGPSQVIEVGGKLTLIDCGSGALHRLLEAGYHLADVERIAFTHLHSDHITGLPDLLWAGWIGTAWQNPPPVVGPAGTAEFVRDLLHAFRYDIGVRTRGERLQRERLEPSVEEIEDGWTLESDRWRLTGFRVDHAPLDQAFGFRLDTDGGSVVVSGDTRPSENLVRHAQNADVLIHEVYWRRGALALEASITDPAVLARREMVHRYHTHSEEVGDIAERAGAKSLILSHILFRGGTGNDLTSDIAAQYRGPVLVGEDLLSVPLRTG